MATCPIHGEFDERAAQRDFIAQELFLHAMRDASVIGWTGSPARWLERAQQVATNCFVAAGAFMYEHDLAQQADEEVRKDTTQ
jgi:hypothetical protein